MFVLLLILVGMVSAYPTSLQTIGFCKLVEAIPQLQKYSFNGFKNCSIIADGEECTVYGNTYAACSGSLLTDFIISAACLVRVGLYRKP